MRMSKHRVSHLIAMSENELRINLNDYQKPALIDLTEDSDVNGGLVFPIPAVAAMIVALAYGFVVASAIGITMGGVAGNAFTLANAVGVHTVAAQTVHVTW